MLVMESADNELLYRVSTMTLVITTALAHYGDGLAFVDGVEPPPPPKKLFSSSKGRLRFDIVDRRWLGEREAAMLTVGRALAHFGDESGL